MIGFLGYKKRCLLWLFWSCVFAGTELELKDSYLNAARGLGNQYFSDTGKDQYWARCQQVNCSQLLEQAIGRFDAMGLSTPGLDAQVLLAYCMGKDRSFLYSHPDRELSGDEVENFLALVKRRERGEPVAYIMRSKEFWSLLFAVTPDVLIPRPDTEILVDAVLELLERYREVRILEIGTGTGAISVALASELARAYITATDLSQEAISVARMNAISNKVADRISFLCGDLFEPVVGAYDVIVSNPPYISESEFKLLDPGVRDYEPRLALVAGPDGTEVHRKIALGSKAFLKENGWIAMELGAGQAGRIEKMLQDLDYCDITFHRDYAGVERVVLARIRRLSVG